MAFETTVDDKLESADKQLITPDFKMKVLVFVWFKTARPLNKAELTSVICFRHGETFVFIYHRFQDKIPSILMPR